MVKSCCAVGCTNRKIKGSPLGFFTFPFSNPERFQLWVKATKRKDWTPSQYSSLCSDHFQTGAPSKDPKHPDYVPNIFPHTKCRKGNADLYEKRQQRILAREMKKKDCSDAINEITAGAWCISKPYKISSNRPTVDESFLTSAGTSFENMVTFIKPEADELMFFDNDEENMDSGESAFDVSSFSHHTEDQETTHAAIAVQNFDRLNNGLAMQRIEETWNDIPAMQRQEERWNDIPAMQRIEERLNIGPATQTQEERPTRDELMVEFHKLVKTNAELQKQNKELERKYKELECKAKQYERKAIISDSLLYANDSSAKVIKSLEEKVADLQKQSSLNITSSSFLDDPSRCKFYTGLPNKDIFNKILELVLKQLKTARTSKIKSDVKLLMVLIKLRLNLKYEDMGHRFYASMGCVGRIVLNWLPIVGQVLGSFVRWPDRNSISSINSISSCFKNTKYEHCNLVIDICELQTQKMSNQHFESVIENDKIQILKYLLGITPNGIIVYVSECWPGDCSDEMIRKISNDLLHNLKEGDLVIAHKAIPLHDEFAQKGVKLVNTSFKRNKDQSSDAKDIGHLHIARVKNLLRNFKILIDVYPSKHIKLVNAAIHACAGIININSELLVSTPEASVVPIQTENTNNSPTAPENTDSSTAPENSNAELSVAIENLNSDLSMNTENL